MAICSAGCVRLLRGFGTMLSILTVARVLFCVFAMVHRRKPEGGIDAVVISRPPTSLRTIIPDAVLYLYFSVDLYNGRHRLATRPNPFPKALRRTARKCEASGST
jgi:hypothetical protein